MTIVANPFIALTSPNSDPLMWSEGQKLGVIDSVTGEPCAFVYTTADSNIKLYTTPDSGLTWNLKATVNVGAPNGLLSVDQDVTNGAVHAILFDSTGVTNARTYARWALTRSGGHVTGFTVTTSFTLTMHTNSDFDPRGNIYVFSHGGAEQLVYLYGSATTSGPETDLTYYCAQSTSLTPSSSASFSGIGGVGSDTLLISLTDATGTRTNHTFEAMLAQETSTENLYLFVGHIYSGDTLKSFTSGAVSDLWYKQLPKVAGGWTAPTATTAGTTIVSDDGTSCPNIMAVYTGTARAYVMYMSPTAGVKFSYIDSAATLNTISASPLSTAHRGGFGTFTVNSSNNIYTVFNTEGVNTSITPTGALAYYNGTSWTTNVTDATAVNQVAMFGFGKWASGCAAFRVAGDSVAQTVVGNGVAGTASIKAAVIYSPTAPFVNIALMPSSSVVFHYID